MHEMCLNSNLLGFADRIYRIRKYLHPITIVKRLSHTWEKRFIQSEISYQNESVSSQRVRVVDGASIFNLHSQKLSILICAAVFTSLL